MLRSSYPLMSIAREFGADYGDVLLWAGHLRHIRAERPLVNARVNLAYQAYERIVAGMLPHRRRQMVAAMVAHVNARWGKTPEQVFIP